MRVELLGCLMLLAGCATCGDMTRDERFPVPPNWMPFLTRENALAPCNGHVQGMCVSSNAIYMALHTGLYKFDWKGNLLTSVPSEKHMGDLCWWKGRIYAAICLPGKQPDGMRGRIDVYDEDLKLVKRTKFVRSADGITCANGVLYVGLGPLPDFRGAWFGKFDAETLQPLCQSFTVENGFKVSAGVQNMASDGKKLYVGYYTPVEGAPCFFVYDLDFKLLEHHVFGWRHGFDLVGGAKGDAVRFIWLETIGWMKQKKDGSTHPPQALANYAELRDGKITDISYHISFRQPFER